MEFIEFLEKNRPLHAGIYGSDANGEPFVELNVRWTDEARKAVTAVGIEFRNSIYEWLAPNYLFRVPKKYTKQVLEIIIEDKQKELAKKLKELKNKYEGRIAILESLKVNRNGI